MTNVRKKSVEIMGTLNKRNQLRGRRKRAINNSGVFTGPRKNERTKMRGERLMETERTITMMGN